MKLYEITAEMKELQSLVDNEELTAEIIADTMEAMNIAFEDKARSALKVRQHLLADVADIDSEIDRLKSLRVAPANNAERIKEYVRENMEASGTDKSDLGVFRLTLRKPTKQLGEIDETKVPDDYWVVVPETRKLDKKKLLADAKDQSLDFVELVDGQRALLIK